MYDPQIGRFTGVDPLAETMPAWGSYTYSFSNPIRFTDPLGLAPEDIIFLDKDGNETGRIENEEEDRYFVETEGCDNSGNSCTDLLEVNSPQTIKGDPKSENPWNGSVVNLDTDEIKEDITSTIKSLDEEYISVTSAVIQESQRNGELDYVDEFSDGTIYEIDGIHYNSHEGLNYKWGAAMDQLGYPAYMAVGGAKLYHGSAWATDHLKDKSARRYTKVGPINEANHEKAIKAGTKLFKK